MKITFEANLPVRNRKLLGALMAALILLSASSVYLLNEDSKLSSNLRSLDARYNALLSTYNDSQRDSTKLAQTRDQLYNKLNQTVMLERKYWGIPENAYNITLRPRDTLRVTIRLNAAHEPCGIDGVDRLEITWVGLYSPSLGSRETTSARVVQYFGGSQYEERWIGEKIIGLSGQKRMIVVPDPISHDTIVRESVNSVSFFFENYNYLGYSRPGSSITLKMFYDGNVPVVIRELEIYVVGFVDVTVGDTPDVDTGWICNQIEWKVQPWGEMT